MEWLEGVFTTFVRADKVPDDVRFDDRAPKWRDAFTLLCATETRMKLRGFYAASSLIDWKKIK